MQPAVLALSPVEEYSDVLERFGVVLAFGLELITVGGDGDANLAKWKEN